MVELVALATSRAAQQRHGLMSEPATPRAKSPTTRDSFQERHLPALSFGLWISFVICSLSFVISRQFPRPFQHFSPKPSAISTISKTTLKNPRHFNKAPCDFLRSTLLKN
jgi:hypothetical protein